MNEYVCGGDTLARCDKRFTTEQDAEEHVRATGHTASEFTDGLPTDFKLWPSDSTAAVYDNADQLRGRGKVEGRDFRLVPIALPDRQGPGSMTKHERALRKDLDELRRLLDDMAQKNRLLEDENKALRETTVEQADELRRIKSGTEVADRTG